MSFAALMRGVIMWNRSLLFRVIGILLVCVGAAPAQAVTKLDTAFGVDGRVAVELGAGNSGHAVIVQSDGRIVVAGSSLQGVSRHFSLVRFNRDGSLDTTFNGEGAVITPVSSGDSEALALGLLPDGRIIAAGYGHNGVDRDFALVCYFADGSLDRSFGENGVVIDRIGNGHEEITAMLIDSKGMITVAGSVTGTTGRVLAVARYYPDGAPDAAFGEGGASLVGVGVDATAEGIVEGEYGGLVVSGSCEADGRTTLMLVGLTASGAIDPGFGVNGVAIASEAFAATEGYGLAVDSEGRLYLAGSTGVAGQRDAALFRFRASGVPDTTFGEQGAVVTRVSEEDDVLYDVSVGPGGVVASGFTTDAGLRRFLLITYDETGSSAVAATAPTDPEIHAVEPEPEMPAAIQEVRVHGDTRVQIRELQVYPSFSGYTAASGAFGGADPAGAPQNFLTQLGSRLSAFLLPAAVAADDGSEASGLAAPTTARVLTTTFSEGEAVSYAVTTDEEGHIIVIGTADGGETSLMVVARYEGPSESSDFVNQPGYTSSAIITRTPGDVTRTSVVTGGEITPAFGRTVTRRGVVFSTTPDPVYSGGTDGNGGDNGAGDDENGGPTVTIVEPAQNAELTNPAVTLSVQTDVNATCKYGTTATSAAMEAFSQTGSRVHTTVLNLEADASYTYYVRCLDESTGTENSVSASVSFSVAASSSINLAPPRLLDAVAGFLVTDAVAAASSASSTRSVFSETDASGAEDFVKEGETENGSGYGRFSTRVENLQPGTTFYVRAYAQTATGEVYYGNQESFRTADACFVATASFGSILHPGVAILRGFRDSFLVGNPAGRWLMDSYYAVSPSLAEIIAANNFLRGIVRLFLLPFIGLSWLMLHAGAGSVLLTFAALAVVVGRFTFPVRRTV